MVSETETARHLSRVSGLARSKGIEVSGTIVHPDCSRNDTHVCQDSCMTLHYLGMGEIAERTGLTRNTLNSYASKNLMPAPDVTIGDVRGWTAATIDRWMSSRPGRGARTDLARSRGKK